MLLGKPVIADDVSGRVNFCGPDNALSVDCGLVAVSADSYVAAAERVWPDPPIERESCSVVVRWDDRRKGRQTVSDDFSASANEQRYRVRVAELDVIRLGAR
jgi:hypothetical protein